MTSEMKSQLGMFLQSQWRCPSYRCYRVNPGPKLPCVVWVDEMMAPSVASTRPDRRNSAKSSKTGTWLRVAARCCQLSSSNRCHIWPAKRCWYKTEERCFKEVTVNTWCHSIHAVVSEHWCASSFNNTNRDESIWDYECFEPNPSPNRSVAMSTWYISASSLVGFMSRLYLLHVTMAGSTIATSSTDGFPRMPHALNICAFTDFHQLALLACLMSSHWCVSGSLSMSGWKIWDSKKVQEKMMNNYETKWNTLTKEKQISRSTSACLRSCGRCQPCAQEPAPQSTTRTLRWSQIGRWLQQIDANCKICFHMFTNLSPIKHK